jgi:hypothetical protein
MYKELTPSAAFRYIVLVVVNCPEVVMPPVTPKEPVTRALEFTVKLLLRVVAPVAIKAP